MENDNGADGVEEELSSALTLEDATGVVIEGEAVEVVHEDFVTACKREVRRQREYLECLPDGMLKGGRVEFRVEASFQLHSGAMELKFGVGTYGGEVWGPDLNIAINEWLRRKGYARVFTPICLPRVGD